MEKIKVEKLVPGGQGLGNLDNGKKAFFWNALPGEIVTEFEITKKKSHYIEAIATKISNPSPHRIVPKDECYLSTSPWQIMDYNYELSEKIKILKENFRQVNIEVDPKECKTDHKDFFYRNKMEYALYYDFEDEKIKPAFHKRGSHRKIIVQNSSIERPEIFQKAVEIIDGLNEKNDEARRYQSLLLRCNQDGKVEGGLLEKYQPHPTFDNLTDKILGQEYSYSPNGFFQINLPVYEMALSHIKRHIKTNKVLDLYSGVGTIGLSVAGERELILVESNKAAYQELVKNCERSTFFANSPRPILAKSEECLEYIAPDQTVILDPPRAGCDKKLLEKLLSEQPQKIIYLSCNPATQARDVSILQQKYIINDIIPFNFFPRTPHLENLIILEISQNR